LRARQIAASRVVSFVRSSLKRVKLHSRSDIRRFQRLMDCRGLLCCEYYMLANASYPFTETWRCHGSSISCQHLRHLIVMIRSDI